MRLFVIGLCVALAPITGTAAELSGQVELRVTGGSLHAAQSQDAVVYFRPEQSVALAVPRTEFEMRMRDKRFEPQTLTIPIGATVRFPNSDPILHNVFSTSGANRFDLGFSSRGEGRTRTFAQPGLVRVYCNVHHQMVGHILVLDTPYVTRPDAEGRYRLSLPRDTRGELFVWHPRARLWRQHVASTGNTVLDVRIDLHRPLIAPHTNKFGKPYERRAGHGY